MYKNKAGQERYLEEELLSLKNEKAVKSVVEAYINEVGVPNIPNLPQDILAYDTLVALADDMFEKRQKDFVRCTENANELSNEITYTFDKSSFAKHLILEVKRSLLKNDNTDTLTKLTKRYIS